MENLSFGLQIMVIGFSVVMVALVMLYVILLMFGKFSISHENRSQSKQPDPAVKTKPPKEVYQAPAEDDSLVAAITAALCTFMNTGADSFRIGKIKTVASGAVAGSGWISQGRRRQLEQAEQLALVRRRKNI